MPYRSVSIEVNESLHEPTGRRDFLRAAGRYAAAGLLGGGIALLDLDARAAPVATPLGLSTESLISGMMGHARTDTRIPTILRRSRP